MITFVDVAFFWFLPVVWVVHWALPRRAALQNAWLLCASWAFYAAWSPALLGLLVLSSALDFGLARGAAPGRVHARLCLWGSVAVNLGVLAWFKYAGFFAEDLAALCASLGLELGAATFDVVLPVGLSFYSLQKLGYVLDVHDGRCEPERSPWAFGLFCGFFAQVVAGPISRGPMLLPQLAAARRLRAQDLARGAFWFLHGFALKGLVADRVGSTVLAGDGTWDGVVGPVFRFGAEFSAGSHWIALIGCAVEIFCDFAGYSLMAMGVAMLFGLTLPVNFDRPYLSRSLPELWRRWHITLNTWLFDYIYTPLCAGRSFLRGQVAACLMLVFVVSGIWHGPTWPFVLWGALHGFGMMAHHAFDQGYKRLCRRDRIWVARRKGRTWRALSWAMTQVFFLLTLVPFKVGIETMNDPRADGLTETLAFFAALVPGHDGARVDPGSVTNLAILLLCLAVFAAHHAVAWGPGRRLAERFFALPAAVRGIAYGVAIALLALLVPVGAGTFIYRNF